MDVQWRHPTNSIIPFFVAGSDIDIVLAESLDNMVMQTHAKQSEERQSGHRYYLTVFSYTLSFKV